MRRFPCGMDLQTISDRSIQDLLAQQLALVQQVLEFNKEITQRLGNEDKSKTGNFPPTGKLPATGKPAAAKKPARGGEAPQVVDDDPGVRLVADEPRRSRSAQVMKSMLSSLDGFRGVRSSSTSLVEPMLPPASPGPDPEESRGLARQFKPQKKNDDDGPRAMFPNADDIKERVVSALNKPEYNVESLYKQTGCFQAIATNKWFKNLTLLVIAINTIWIAIETDRNKAEVLSQAPLLYQIVDNAFCFFFVFEIVVRFFSFRKKVSAATDGQFMFDLFLVALMVWETWITVFLYWLAGGAMTTSGSASSVFRIFRLFRLTRVARLGRLLRNMPELMILVKGMLMAMRSVSATLMLLVIIIYVFAILFTQLLWNDPVGKGCFETVPMAMHCLLMNGVFSEEKEFIDKMLSRNVLYYVFILCYLLLGSLTVMNMLIGVICEVVSVVARVEKDELLAKDLKHKIQIIQSHFKVEGSDMVTEESFKELLSNHDAMQSLHDCGVDVVALVDFADFIFREKDSLSLSEFIGTVLQFRGSNTATVKDVVDMRKFVSREFYNLTSSLVAQKTFQREVS